MPIYRIIVARVYKLRLAEFTYYIVFKINLCLPVQIKLQSISCFPFARNTKIFVFLLFNCAASCCCGLMRMYVYAATKM